MATPAYAAAGAGASAISSTTLSVPYPASISAGNLLVLQIFRKDTETTDPSPGGAWTVRAEDNLSGGSTQLVYTATATGSESGSLSVTVGSQSSGVFGRMYRFTGDAGTWSFESGNTTNGTDSSVEMPSQVTTGAERLALCFIGINDNNTIGSSTGESNGNWTEAVAEYSTGAGGDCCIQLQTAALASATTLSGGTSTQSASDAWVARTIAIYVASAAKELAADAGSYTVTGQTAGTQYGRVVAAGAGSYAVTGQDATFNRTYRVDAGAGSYAVTGQTAALEHDKLLEAGAGSYAVTGQNATLAKGLTLSAEAGAYAVTGQDATFNRTYAVDAGAGSYAVAGQTAALEHDKQVVADSGSYAVTGQTAALAKGLTVAAEAGSYVVTGQDATFDRTYAVDADAGSYAVSGADAALSITDRILEAGAGSYTVTGQDASLEYTPGAYNPCPTAVEFDGSTYLTRGAALDGVSDGRQGTLPFWLRRVGTASSQLVFRADNGCVSVTFNGTTGVVDVLVADASQSSALVFASTGSLLADGDWHHVLIAWDTDFSAGNKLAEIYIDGSLDVTIFADGQAAFDVAYAAANDWAFGNNPAGSGTFFTGELADPWFIDEYLNDPLLFIDGSVQQIDLGSDGSNPSSSQPIIFLRGPAADFGNNTGTGGDFTAAAGAVDDAATSPPCAEGSILLIAAGGSYAVTGQNAALEFDRQLIADSGAYTVTGQNATLQYGKTLVADPGSYAVSGSDADLYFNRLIEANAGGYVITGSDADLTYTPGGTPVTETPVGGHFLPEYPRRKYRNLNREMREAVKQAVKELRGEVERVEETAGVSVAVPVAAEVRDRLAGILAAETQDYLTPVEAARQLIVELIAEQNRRDEEEAAFIIMALGA